MIFFASIRYTKGLGNTSVYVRLRRSDGYYWNWTTLLWEALETAPSKLYLTEEPDSSALESRYSRDIDIPVLSYTTIVEYVNASNNVIGEDTIPAQTTATIYATLPEQIKLSARLLSEVGSVNNWKVISTAEWTQGDRPAIYFQLVDCSVDKTNNPPYRRWMPPILATGENRAVVVTITDIDTAYTTSAVAHVAFDQDPSIYLVDLLENVDEGDEGNFVGTYAMRLAVEEGPTLTADSSTPNPLATTLVVNETIPTATPQEGYIYVDGVRLPYISWTSKTFTFETAAPVMVPDAALWVVVPPNLNGTVSQAFSIAPITSEF